MLMSWENSIVGDKKVKAMQRFFLWLLIIFSLTMPVSYGQGCSDAGFCTINSIKPLHGDSTSLNKNQIKIGAFFGSADYSITVWGNYLEYNSQLSEKIGFDAKLTSLAQTGNGINTFGLGDIFLSGNYKINKRLNFTIGTKILLTNGNKKIDGNALPMDYQSSLGTLDLIAGLGYEVNKFHFVLALQQPLTQNKNEFFSENYSSASPLSQIQSTNGFRRSGDVLLRLSYPIKLLHRLKLTPSLLPIYHVSNDKYTDNSGLEKEIIGSQGLTLNGNLYFDFDLSKTSALQLNFGMPFIARDARPDGLTRSFIANLEYRIVF